MPWHVPVVPTTPEVEIKKIMVPNQPRQKVRETPAQPKSWALVVHACDSSYAGGTNRRIRVWGWGRGKN
jgi:hypothetical protein